MSTGTHPSGRSDEELRAALAAAMASVAEAVRALGGDDWERPSPCDGWGVADVVDHLVMGDVFAARVLHGATLDESIVDLHGIGDDRAAAARLVESSAEAARAGFAGPLDRVVHHPVGQISARQFLGYRVLDQLGHAWDIRRATGQPEDFDATALAVAVDVASAERPMLERSAHFGPDAEAALDDGVDALGRFLVLIGRSTEG